MSEEDKVNWEVDYWPNGQKYYEIPHVNGERHGIETWWHENGHKDLERPWVNGQRHGVETRWHEDGSLWYIGKWNQGQEVVEFDFQKSYARKGKVPEIYVLRNEFKLL